MKTIIFFISILCFLTSCRGQPNKVKNNETEIETKKIPTDNLKALNTQLDLKTKTIHIIVALCDNKYQGIVPVPKSIGNGQDPKNNLYWGAAYGIKTYFKRSSEWQLIKQEKIDSLILERLIFKHNSQNYYIVADAYNGRYIKNATKNFLRSSAGIIKDTVKIDSKTIGIKGNSKLIAYIGHDGLMDFNIQEKFINTDNQIRDVIILACYSKSYFKPHLKGSKVNPLVWTTGLMAPEAYTIHDAITGYLKDETNDKIRLRAAKAYHEYQKCGLNGAKNLLVTN
ncbi:hypothetical protein [Tenacibaculum ovolyticum]|uniref:hypothetical protein n=1 Tax=Tenacibaculum ovolyticum TaxID=104270 RepID=UPI000417AACB|nr:hypothetical protein [Tenacibaculum ovolyticum]